MGKRKKAEGDVEVRMLVDVPLEGELLPCNTIQVLDADSAAALAGAGLADAAPEAVEAARESAENKAYQAKLAATRKSRDEG